MTEHGPSKMSVDEGLRKRFEEAWHKGRPVPIEDCLPAASDPQHLATLEELVHIELEFLWRNWSESRQSVPPPTRIEDYLGRFPALNQPPIVLRLARQEYFARKRWGDKPSSDEYRRRFPEQIHSEKDLETQSIMASTLPGKGARGSTGSDLVDLVPDGPARGHLRVQCPHCRSPIELDPDAPLREIACPSCGSAFSLVSEADTVSRHAKQRTLGHFELLDHLGMGQFGSVWRAHDTTLDRIVALKIPRREHLDQELFFREARAAAQLRHPNIVSVHEIGRDGETVYIACDFVQGANLQEWLGTKKLNFRQVAELCLTVAEALHHAHEAGVVHRDLKPSNIMIDTEGRPHLMDFGLAKRESGEITMTVRGQVLGTLAYMPPEQARGEGHEADRRADVYSLGTVLYQLLTGELPFRGERRMMTVQILTDEPAPPRRLDGRIPRDLETICLKCMEKQPDRRYQTAADLADDLRRYCEGKPILARPVGRSERAWRWCKRNPSVASLSAATVLLLLATTVISSWAAISSAAKNREITRKNIETIKQKEEITRQNEEITRRNEEINRQNQEIEQKSKEARQYSELAMAVHQNLINAVSTATDSPQTRDLKMALLKAALEGMKRMSDEMGDKTAADPTYAAALRLVANGLRTVGQTEQAVGLYRQVYDLVKPRPEIMQGSDASRYNVAGALWSLAVVDEEVQRDMEASRARNAEALSILQDIHDHPSSVEGSRPKWITEYALAEGHQRMGVSLMRLGQSSEAVKHYLRALELRQSLADRLETDPDLAKLPSKSKLEIQQSVATSHLAAGDAIARSRSAAEARLHFETAVRLRESAWKANPESVTAKQDMGRAAGMWGEFLFHAGNLEDALQQNELSCRIADEVAAADPKNVECQRDLGVALYRRGVLLQSQGDASASDWFNRCREIRRKLAALSEANEKRRRELTLVLAHTDEYSEAARLAREFRSMEKVDNEVLLDVARSLSQCSLHAESDADARGYREEAIGALKALVDKGYRDRLVLEWEADLKPLHNDEAFRQLLAHMQ